MVASPTTIEDYISTFPPAVQDILTEVRQRIHRAVPGAGETISYRIPTITLAGRHLIYFAAWTHHLSVYPVPAADDQLAAELAAYRAAKGTLRFPLDRPIPYQLIERVAAGLATQRSSPQVG
jgi:uncharacterized protein YdhG (YjbR/CyaY superfamily)